MKKVAAALVALLMVVVAVAARSRLDTSNTETQRVQVLCAQIIVDACNTWKDGGANISVRSGDTSQPAAADTVVIGLAVATQDLSTVGFGSYSVVTSSPLVFISKKPPPCPDPKLACFAKLTGDLAVDRSPDALAALEAATAGDPDIFDKVTAGSVIDTDTATVAKVQNIGIPQAAIMIRALVGPAATLAILDLRPAAKVTLVGFVRTGAASGAQDLVRDEGLRTALRTAGWN